ncbi:MAG: LuxR C-terminal-related transcriptional regulator [Oscillospiraceae bacterium]|nr:LuxR C-terminal-related transcriptional regulator [Oscillospiraceae bacterium]
MADDPVEITANDSFFAARYVPRPRIDRMLEAAVRGKLVYVIAGAGYGKTQVVRRFIERQPETVVRWLQLSENDNIGSRYWDNLTHNISFDNPELAQKMRQFGFPETLARFKQFAGFLKHAEHRAVKTFLVLDDFHLIQSEQALAFAERCAYLQIPGACVIIISRKEPEINAVPLLAKGQVSIITEDELRFTEDEIAEFLKQCGVPFSAKNLPRVMDATKGWALAIQLFSLSLKRNPGNLDSAIDSMKQNIFKLMEIEAFNDFPEKTQKLLTTLSMASSLPLTVLQKFFNDVSFLRAAPQLTSFVWFDSFTGTERVHPLYWEFLQSKQYLLTPEEKHITYQRAAKWCFENNFTLDAMYYFARSRDYARMVELLFSHPFKLPHDTCEYFLEILENLDPEGEARDDTNLLMLKHFFIPLLLAGTGRYEEARQRTLGVIREWESSDTPAALKLLYTSYSNLVYIDLYTCTVTHRYNAPEYIKKSREYFKRSSLPPATVSGAFAVADVRSLACLVGEGADLPEFDQFLDATRQTAVYVAETRHSMYYGYDDLVACELAFYRNQPESARAHAHQAVLKAREKKQYSIEAMAAQYLLRISMLEGDHLLAREILKQLRVHLSNPDFWNRQLLYDLFTGFFYAQIGLPKRVPSWLIMDEKEATSEVRIPIRELLVCVRSHLASKKYHQALTVLLNSYPREPQERFLLTELTLTLLTAAARLQTGDTPGALRDFEKAYSLSFQGVFEIPFVELGRHLRPLIAAVSAQDGCGIPREWLKAIDRKASIYAKKTAVILNALKEESHTPAAVLSEREQEVLNDLYHGLSREEIAEHRYLSINTVKKILQSIYLKLDANNNVDAIRTAMEMNLLE